MKTKIFFATIVMALFFGVNVSAGELYKLDGDHAFKAYMSYKAISNKNSPQYDLQQYADTDSTGLRVLGNRYIIAIGTGFDAPVGSVVDVYLEDGTVIPCVVGDIKQNKDTDRTNTFAEVNGNVVEFIVDTKILDDKAKKMGDVSHIDGFSGNVEAVEILN